MPEIAYVDNISATIFTPQISNFKKLERISMLQDNFTILSIKLNS